MLRLTSLTLSRGTKRLLHDADLTVHAGQKVGIVGANGSGKSSLLAAIRGEILADEGSIELPERWILAHVAQETPTTAAPAIEYVLDGDAELRAIERDLAAAGAAPSHADAAAHGVALAELHHRFEAIGGYGARSRAATLLAGLGFSEARQRDPVATFSGGWRMRLNLAQALMCRSDLLLLDEPTNHLDLDAVLWLEDWLARYPGTLLLVTHDRDFLDAVVDSIVHVDRLKLTRYSGNYAQFERERAQQLALQQAAYSKQQRQIEHLRSYIDRFRAKATKAKQAQSRIKALERMELIAAAHVDSPFSFSFPEVEHSARQLVKLEHATLAYRDDSPPVLAEVDWSVLSGARIGLLGANGAGKSTLLKALSGTLALREGRRHVAQHLRIGYFAQHQVEALRLEHTPLWHLQRLEPATREQELRDYLGGFDLRGDMATAAVERFSGGEKARLTLALIVRERPNLLLLDEPTNHLDIEMREALTEALQDYGGALVVVAHDRHLLRATADELWLVDSGRVRPFDGDLDDYRDYVLGLRRRESPEDEQSSIQPRGVDRKAQKRAEAEARQRRADARKPLLARQAKLEASLAQLGEEKTSLDAWLASPDAYVEEARARLTNSLARQGEITWSLATLEAQWLEIAEQLDAIDQSSAES
ncbi:MAG TPA: ATP-binding cassette domain-containing protein [Casimicrobiaceae bacterium]|nr:ATP-binding cassette domain-containing protein [Casimicrobiaceae bacterium]